MGAQDSKTSSRYSEKMDSQDDMAKMMVEKQRARARKHQTQKFKSKLSSNAEAFAPSATLHPVAAGRNYADQKDEPWVQFLMQKERERSRRSIEQIGMPAPKQSILLQTGEYLKLLKSTDNTTAAKKGKGFEKARLRLMAEGKGTMTKDISTAVDDIIQSRCKQEKLTQVTANIISNDSAILNIAKMLKANTQISEVAATRKPENVALTQDDIMLEKFNKDEDLADPVYWSEDELATRYPRKASAHKLGHRPRNDPETLRDYVMQDLDSQLDKEVAKLLCNANRLAIRHKALEPNVPQVRYIVAGIKDVCRALKYGKVKCVFIAPDIEDSTSNGGVDDRLRDILATAYQADVPVVFALSRARMGMAFGKSLKMSVIGLQETKGICEQFDNVLSSAYQKRVSWVERKLPR